MREEICYSDATELAASIRARKVSPVEVVGAFLERIAAVNPKLKAIVTPADNVKEQARTAEKALTRGRTLGPFHGVPFTVKDCFDTAGVRTTRGSRLFQDHVPRADATAVRRMKEAGGIFIGKTNMPEFALWWETDNAVFGRTENPWKLGRTPGGSSGGEAAAIAAGLSPLGLGSDLGGSIREPAHYCGIVGLKPTHGRVPLTGHWPDVLLRFMHTGPLARSVRDIALALSVISGPDGQDPYALPVTPFEPSGLEGKLPALRIGWCAEGPFAPVATDVQQTVASAAVAFQELGCQVKPVSLSSWKELQAQDISMVIYSAEGAHYLKPIIAGREDQLAPPMQRRAKLPIPSFAEYLEAMSKCERLRQDMVHYFAEYDLLLCPTGPLPAHPHDSVELTIEGQKVPGRNALRATLPADLTGSPAISVPFGWSKEGLPIGVQLIAAHFNEALLLKAAAAIEALAEAPRRRPPV